MKKPAAHPDTLWDRHAAEWRDPAQITSQWREAAQVDPRLLKGAARGRWWETLERLGLTLLITREYEHLVVAMSARGGRPRVSFFPVPHPSGLAVDASRARVYLASTRNPNQVYTLAPASGLLDRTDAAVRPRFASPLVPVASSFYPGCLYLHDLAWMAGRLYANAVGHNAVVRLGADGAYERVWWPECIERGGEADFSRNYIQLNSIAAGASLASSYFSASSCALGRLRPGHLNYKVDGQGVIFSGRTRQPVCTGLTRPHSARLWRRRIWVANSGYGEVGYVEDGRFRTVIRLPGWTRGLCLTSGVAFAATSRVIPRFARYAPGLDPDRSSCGVHAFSLESGALLGSYIWPIANQVFAVESLPGEVSSGFVFEAGARPSKQEIDFFYRYKIDTLTPGV